MSLSSSSSSSRSRLYGRLTSFTSGKLIVSIKKVHLYTSSSPHITREVRCEVMYDGVSSSCSTTSTSSSFESSTSDAVLDIPEYYGYNTFRIQVTLKQYNTSKRRFSIFNLLKKWMPSRRLATVELPVREALPQSRREVARRIADSMGVGGNPLHDLPIPRAQHSSHWNDSDQIPAERRGYWPTITIPLMNKGELVLEILFVPIVPANRIPNGFTELHKAAYSGDHGLVSALLVEDTCLSIHDRTKDHMMLSPLDIAVLKGDLTVTSEMLATDRKTMIWDRHAEQRLHGSQGKRSSLHNAIIGGNAQVACSVVDHFSAFSIIEMLDMQDENGWTALMMAAEKAGMSEVLVRLIEAGANAELVNKNGDTALLIACANGNEENAKILLRYKCTTTMHSASTLPSNPSASRPNKANYAGESALTKAAGSSSCPDIIRALLDAYAVPAFRNADGATCLHVAAYHGFKENCEELVNWLYREREEMSKDDRSLGDIVGSAIAQSLYFTLIKDHKGNLPSDLAASAGHSDLAQWLREVEKKDSERLEAEMANRNVIEDSDVYDMYNMESE